MDTGDGAVARDLGTGLYREPQPATHLSPKLGPFVGIVNQILQDDREVLKKQRHTAKRIFERLRDEHGYAGGYTVVREFVAKEQLRQREIFVPLAHLPGRFSTVPTVHPFRQQGNRQSTEIWK